MEVTGVGGGDKYTGEGRSSHSHCTSACSNSPIKIVST